MINFVLIITGWFTSQYNLSNLWHDIWLTKRCSFHWYSFCISWSTNPHCILCWLSSSCYYQWTWQSCICFDEVTTLTLTALISTYTNWFFLCVYLYRKFKKCIELIKLSTQRIDENNNDDDKHNSKSNVEKSNDDTKVTSNTHKVDENLPLRGLRNLGNTW